MSNKFSTPAPRSRRCVALRLLRIREASGLTQQELGKRVGVSRRAMGGIERAEHRMSALEAFFEAFDLAVETKGLDAALVAILPQDSRTEPLIRSVASGMPRIPGLRNALATREKDPEVPGHVLRKTALADRDRELCCRNQISGAPERAAARCVADPAASLDAEQSAIPKRRAA